MKNKKNSKDSNVGLGIVGTVTTLYGVYTYLDSKFNGGTNEELEKTYRAVSIFDIALGLVEIGIAFRREAKERKTLEEAIKKA